MNIRARSFTLVAVAAAAVVAASAALAAPQNYQLAGAAGSYYSDDSVVINTNGGQNLPTVDGSVYRFVTCVGSEPGSPGCTVSGLPPPSDAWYKWPSLPTSAAAQAHAPDYGINKARAWSSGVDGMGTGAPGYTAYGASAQSGWVDEITTASATPVTITFVVSLHANWNDGGVLALMMGRPGDYDPEVGGATPMTGRTWTNCANCVFAYDTGLDRTLLPGGDDGSADRIVTVDFVVYPASFGDPEDPTSFSNRIESMLFVSASYDDAEVDAFSTASLQTILVPPHAQLSFASGHAYNVQVIPEPATYALWSLGLVGVLLAARRGTRTR